MQTETDDALRRWDAWDLKRMRIMRGRAYADLGSRDKAQVQELTQMVTGSEAVVSAAAKRQPGLGRRVAEMYVRNLLTVLDETNEALRLFPEFIDKQDGVAVEPPLVRQERERHEQTAAAMRALLVKQVCDASGNATAWREILQDKDQKTTRGK